MQYKCVRAQLSKLFNYLNTSRIWISQGTLSLLLSCISEGNYTVDIITVTEKVGIHLMALPVATVTLISNITLAQDFS